MDNKSNYVFLFSFIVFVGVQESVETDFTIHFTFNDIICKHVYKKIRMGHFILYKGK